MNLMHHIKTCLEERLGNIIIVQNISTSWTGRREEIRVKVGLMDAAVHPSRAKAAIHDIVRQYVLPPSVYIWVEVNEIVQEIDIFDSGEYPKEYPKEYPTTYRENYAGADYGDAERAFRWFQEVAGRRDNFNAEVKSGTVPLPSLPSLPPLSFLSPPPANEIPKPEEVIITIDSLF